MKNSYRRLISLVMVLALIFSVTAVLNSCYVVRSGKMKNIEGTYVLSTYSGDGDYKEQRGITLYMVLRSDGTGYYAYSSNGTEPHIAELRCSWVSDTEKSGHYSYVKINFRGDGEYVEFAINNGGSSTSLNKSTAYWGDVIKDGFSIKYYITSTFSRVDKSTDLSYINENFGTYEPIPYGALRFDGGYELDLWESFGDDTEGNPFVYCMMDLDIVKKQMTTYYMLKSDEIAHKETHAVSLLSSSSIKIGETEITLDGSLASYSYSLRIPTANGRALTFDLTGSLTEEYVDQQIETKYGAYLSEKTVRLIEEGISALMTNGSPDTEKYSPEAFAKIDALIAELIGVHLLSEKSIDGNLIDSYKKMRLHYLINEARANVEAAYAASTEPAKDMYKDSCNTKIATASIKSYTFSAVVNCTFGHEDAECDCKTFVLAEDAATTALKVFTKEYCDNLFKVATE